MNALKRILTLSHAEHRLLLISLIYFRNELVQQNKSTDDVNDLLTKIYNTKRYRHG